MSYKSLIINLVHIIGFLFNPEGFLRYPTQIPTLSQIGYRNPLKSIDIDNRGNRYLPISKKPRIAEKIGTDIEKGGVHIKEKNNIYGYK
jgi:hypothetical protein